MIYVYALTDSAGVPSTLGLEDRPVEVVGGPQVYAACGRLERTLPAIPDNLWRHEEVVEELMRDSTVLPARFGTCFGTESGLRATLYQREPELARGLDRVRGAVELGVRALWQWDWNGEDPTAPLSEPPDPGRTYMLRRLAAERHRRERKTAAEQLTADLHASFASIARDQVCRTLETPGLLLSGAYLVRDGDVEAFRRRAEEVADSAPQVKVLCTGPWPPYHFVPDVCRGDNARA